MGREIKKSVQSKTLSASSTGNDFKDRLVKLIPSEIITAYITISGIILSASTITKDKRLLFIIVISILLILTPLYLRKVSGVQKSEQIILSTIAFIIWIIATGGFKIIFPEATLINSELFGSVILILFTIIVPIFYKG
ncbi:MAG TPA: hypothetical protein PKE30_08550 [Niabella sp.]|nr:hypothetical protein [Niabella sp.]